MYLVGREKFPYGLSQTVLHTLLGGSIGTLFKSKIGHQKALSVISSNRLLWQNSALVKRQAETLTPDWFRGKYAVLGILMIWVSEFFTAASQNDSFSLAKVSQCTKAILRRCNFSLAKVPQYTKVILTLIQASEVDSNFSQTKEARNSSSPACFCIRPARPLCLGDGRYPKELETAHATVRVRIHDPIFSQIFKTKQKFDISTN